MANSELSNQNTWGHNGQTMEAILAEFNALRAEIIYRMENADRLILVSNTVSVTLLGLGLAHDRGLLLIVPILVPLLGILYLNQLRHVTVLGAYIRKRLSLEASSISGFDVLKWEKHVKEEGKQFNVLYPVQLPNGILAPILSLLLLALTYGQFGPHALPDRWCQEQWLWTAGSILSALFILLWIREELALRSYQRRLLTTPD